ncbi:MAG: DUF402 domain-containing protein [Caldilineaceae bacterium]|nr:DUF402 domain-containing protein [Caldilineaceae bacterium]
MKHRAADRQPWPRVTARRFTVRTFATPEFQGSATLLCIDAVREPLWVSWQSNRFCICDAGYTWVQHFPTHTHYAITTQFDAQGQVVQWYIDICNRHWVDEQGIPWWEDLYLDLLVFPTGGCHIIDDDELDDALQSEVITPALHALAWREAKQLQYAIQTNTFPLLTLTPSHRLALLQSMTETR